MVETKLDRLPSNYVKLLDLLDGGENLTITELCERANVSRQTYYNALRNEEFVKALFHASTSKIYAALPDMLEKMVKQAKNGSFAHQKLLMEVVTLYKGVQPQQVNIDNRTVNFNWANEDSHDPVRTTETSV